MTVPPSTTATTEAPPTNSPATTVVEGACFSPATEGVTVRFANTYGTSDPNRVPIRLLWIDDSCNEVLVSTIQPGVEVDQESYLGDRWRLRNATDDVLLAEVAAEAGLHATYPCSVAGGQPAPVRFVNGFGAQSPSRTAIRVYWVDSACREIPYPTLQPSQEVTHESLVGDQWRVRDAGSGRLLRDITARPGLTVTYP